MEKTRNNIVTRIRAAIAKKKANLQQERNEVEELTATKKDEFKTYERDQSVLLEESQNKIASLKLVASKHEKQYGKTQDAVKQTKSKAEAAGKELVAARKAREQRKSEVGTLEDMEDNMMDASPAPDALTVLVSNYAADGLGRDLCYASQVVGQDNIFSPARLDEICALLDHVNCDSTGQGINNNETISARQKNLVAMLDVVNDLEHNE